MSETIDDTGATPAPEAQEQAPEAAPPPPAELSEAAEKRIARLTARLSSTARERDELSARITALERVAAQYQQPQQPVDPQLEQAIEARAQQKANADRMQDRVRTFHEQGSAEFADWRQRCTDLQAMGADPGFAELLVEMPAGHKVAAALVNEPDEVERIASIRSERGRAIALGQFAARMEAQPTRNVSKAPAPPKPVTGRVAPEFNPYNPNNTTDTLVDFFMKQNMERRH